MPVPKTSKEAMDEMTATPGRFLISLLAMFGVGSFLDKLKGK